MEAKKKLLGGEKLSLKEFEQIVLSQEVLKDEFQKRAKEKTEEIFSDKIYIRGLIEVTNVCKNDCFYCGIRKSNNLAERYSLTDEEILECCESGYSAGFRTFVLQGGEVDKNYVDLVKSIRKKYPDCAITLSLGEKSKEEYQSLFDAGANRYLLRHETADEVHYSKLHPECMKLSERLKCLENLKEIGFQTGCGFMVGSPFQTPQTLAKDLYFIQKFKPQMVGIGPFIPQNDTPFGKEKAGSVEQTLYLLSVLRLMNPKLLLPATTALGSIVDGGREQGILRGANVVMPNISPICAREKYKLYNNKLSSGAEAKEGLKILEENLSKIGRRIAFERGDYAE